MNSPVGAAGTVLEEIVEGVRADLAQRMVEVSGPELERRVERMPSPRDALAALARPGLSVIAEVKRASPSKGSLAAIADPAALALAYESAGASAISVLTERRRFAGSLADLDAVRERVELPVLRKDFMICDYQIWESRAHGADLVLLIVAALSDDDLIRMHTLATELGMAALVEVHNEAELSRAAELGAELIGINARDLTTLEVHPGTYARLAPQLPDQAISVAESGIEEAADATAYAEQGAAAVLVGEALVRHHDPAVLISEITSYQGELR